MARLFTRLLHTSRLSAMNASKEYGDDDDHDKDIDDDDDGDYEYIYDDDYIDHDD